jgi:hypothetical protein
MEAEQREQQMKMTVMEAAKTFALGKKLVKETDVVAAREILTEGEYKLDFLARIKGTIRVGASYEKESTVSLLNEETVCLILGYAGITGPQALKAIEKVYEHKLAQAKGSGEITGALVATDALKTAIAKGKALFDGLKAALPNTKCYGPVTGGLKVTEVKIPDAILEEVYALKVA